MENKNEHKLKFIIYLFCVLGIIIPLIYYSDEIFSKTYNTKDLFFKTLKASQLTNWTLKVFLISVTISLSTILTEFILVGWDKSALKKIKNWSKSTKQDVICYLLSITYLFEFIVFISTLGFFYVISSLMYNTLSFQLTNKIESPVIQFIVLFIFADLVHYFRHRFNHWKAFWELHAYHHSATEFNLITTVRGSFWEAGFGSLFYSFVYLIGGFYIENIIIVHYLREIHLHFCHSNLNWNYGFFGKYIFITPLDHRLHHSKNKLDYDKNFGSVFKWWDLLFNTYKPNTNENIEIGIEDQTIINSNFIQGQLYTNKLFIKRLFNRR
jgi:sterol desaturase/sphingolipid hydroxylase (fatty acid hydroxylase superfamily)